MKLNIKEFAQLTTKELYQIIQARIEVFVIEQDCPYQDCDNKDQNSLHLFLVDQGEIAAYLRIIKPGFCYKEAAIGRVLVAKEYRREGLASKIMKAAIDFIDNNLKTKAIRLSAQEYILNFYQELGFEVVSDRYLEDEIPHFEMLYQL
ncbi:MAG: GNAT family N-acetyltransferase [Bacillota bacterium]